MAARQSEIVCVASAVFPPGSTGPDPLFSGLLDPAMPPPARPALDLRFRERQVDANAETTVEKHQ